MGFNHRRCNWQPTLEDLDSVIEQFEEGEYEIKHKKLGYAVFTKGNDLMSKEEMEDRIAKTWAKRKLRKL